MTVALSMVVLVPVGQTRLEQGLPVLQTNPTRSSRCGPLGFPPTVTVYR